MSGAAEPPSSAGRLPDASTGGDPGLLATQSHVRDLAALFAMPAVWRDRDAAFIGGSLLDILVSLLRIDQVYLRVTDDGGRTLLEDYRPHSAAAPATIRARLEGDAASVAGRGRFISRLENANAEVIAGSQRASFPTAVESFLIRTAVDQAMLAMRTSRLVAELRSANEAKASFLATMSHELRTPLNAVIGYAELLKANIGGSLSEQHRAHVHRIEAASRHLIHIIEGILSFSRLEAGKEELFLSDASISDLSESSLALIEPLASAKQLSVSIAFPPHDCPMWTDIAKVRQILLNLLSNAVKFTAKGTVALEVRYEGDRVLWTVRDTGMGVSADDMARVFEPFRQVGGVHTSRAPGTGLGLTVSRRLALLLGGDVTGVSTPGVGSAFTASLPLRSRSDG